MKNFLIFGTTVFSEVVFEIISQDSPEINLLGFIVDDEFYSKENFCGKRIYKYSELKNNFSTDDIEILVTIGYRNMNKDRQAIFQRLKRDGWNIASYINPNATIRTKEIGFGNIILDDVNIGVKCKIGDGNIFYNGSVFSHHITIGDFNFFSLHVAVAGGVIIGNNCFFGINCCTKNGITISDETFIGAGCSLNSSTKFKESCSAAKMIRYKDSGVAISKMFSR